MHDQIEVHRLFPVDLRVSDGQLLGVLSEDLDVGLRTGAAGRAVRAVRAAGAGRRGFKRYIVWLCLRTIAYTEWTLRDCCVQL